MLPFQGKLLGRAAEICGGWSALCMRLEVDGHSLKMWVEGKARLPARIFLKAADIVLEDDIARAEQDRRAGRVSPACSRASLRARRCASQIKPSWRSSALP